jgi:hypothetical protein
MLIEFLTIGNSRNDGYISERLRQKSEIMKPVSVKIMLASYSRETVYISLNAERSPKYVFWIHRYR